MDNTYRLKIKVGPHEFEAEGPPDVVQEQFLAFKELISTAPLTAAPSPQAAPAQDQNQPTNNGSLQNMAANEQELIKIMRTDGRNVSLTARPRSVDDGVLLILYGQKMLRQNDSVTGGEVMNGLTATGGLSVLRVDRLLEKAGSAGDVIVIGEHRGKRYRLTNAGFNKARQIANDLLATVV